MTKKGKVALRTRKSKSYEKQKVSSYHPNPGIEEQKAGVDDAAELDRFAGVDAWVEQSEFPEKPDVDPEKKRTVLLYDAEENICMYEVEDKKLSRR